MIGDRIRQARLAVGMTLEEVAGRLGPIGHPITKAGLSKYERNKSTPGQAFLAALGKVFKVKASFFVTEPRVSIQWLAFRKRAKMTKTRQEQVKAFAGQVVESQVWLHSTLYPSEKPVFPATKKAQTIRDAERAALRLRTEWRLGEGSIDSLTSVVEDHGGIVVAHGELDTDGQFDGLAGWANGTIPVTVVGMNVPDDRARYNLAHELGHLLMDCSDLDDAEEEKLAHRFASALIVPAAVLRRELGSKRRRVGMREFGVLKRKHGLSMQSLVRRASDLEIIEDSQYKTLCAEFSQFGWKKEEPVEYSGDERPTRLMQMVLRALSERIITEERAERICPGCTEGMPGEKGQVDKSISASALRKLPRDQRDAIMAAAAKKAEAQYVDNRELTDFEAFSEEDLNDQNREAQ
ncbi:MAG: helix-turn-helix domain-containing protein [Planctomycetota bacterium]|jgi:Zn-dependent peptidase ImmA (M78 family)